MASSSLSLKKIIKQINDLNKESFDLRNIDVNLSQLKAKEALLLSEQNDFEDGIAESKKNLGFCYWKLNDFFTASDYLNSSLSIYKKNNDELNISKVHNYLGLVEWRLGNHKSALELLNKSLEFRIKAGDERGISVSQNNIANVLLNIGDYSSALQYYFDALKYSENENNKFFISNIYNNIGLVYQKLDNLDESLEFQTKSFEMSKEINDLQGIANAEMNIGIVYYQKKDFLKSLEYFKSALTKYIKLKDLFGQANCYNNIGSVYESLNDYDKSMVNFFDAYVLRKRIDDKFGISSSLLNIGDLYYHKKQFKEALEFLYEALEIAIESEAKINENSAYYYLARVYNETGDYKNAYENLNKYIKTKDKIFTAESEAKINNLRVLHNIESLRKEAEIEKLRNIELAEALKLVKEQNNMLKNLDSEKNQFLRIAAHDLKNPLSNIIGFAKIIKDDKTELSEKETDEYLGYIIDSSNQMFNIISNLLNTNAIEQGKLDFKIQKIDVNPVINEIISVYKNNANIKNINVIFDKDADFLYINADKFFLKQIIDNLLSNALKFSPFGKEIVIRSYSKNKFAYISVKDSGPGISGEEQKLLFNKFTKLSAKPTGGESSSGLGLSIVKKLVDSMNGSISCKSEPGKGAEFILRFNQF